MRELKPKAKYDPLEDEQPFNKPIPENLTLLNAFEWLYNASRYTCLSDEFMTKAEPVTTYIHDILDLTPSQAVYMSIVIAECAMSSCCDTKDIAVYLGCSPYSSLAIAQELNQLRRIHMLSRKSGFRSTGYLTTTEFMDALNENRPMTKHNLDNLSFDNMFAELRYIIKTTCEEGGSDINLDEVCTDIRDLFSRNRHLDFCLNADNLVDSSNANFFTFVYFCNHLVNFDRDSMSLHKTALDRVLGDWGFSHLEHSLMNGNNELIANGLLEPFTEGGMFEDEFRLTDKVRKTILSEYVPMVVAKRDGMLHPDTITPKQLYYNSNIQKQMDTIEHLLEQENYHAAVDRLEKAGMRRGVAILLSGPAGTGKTEFVLQLARKTGRPIMQVNVSDIKDKFVGESEKRCNAMWAAYNKMVKESPVEPILFLNEADQILGRRFEKVDHSADQMNNSIQNIMLENMEKTNGIMICTTNLAKNLDSAFERRFLFKVELERPTVEARRAIWMSMVPQITEDQANRVAEKYDLSGGQVENIARKLLISTALSGQTDISLEQYFEYCDQELTNEKKNPVGKIGF